MFKRSFVITVIFAFTVFLTVPVFGQASRKSVTAAEVTGTFRYNFTGKFRGSSNEIRILSIGKGRVKVAFDLVYPYLIGKGEPTVNMGTAEGTAQIAGDTAVYSSNEFGPCRIIIRFVKPGMIKVSQAGDDADCGFGHNVMADGVYKKVSSKRPKI